MDIEEIQNTILDRRTKCIPGSAEPFPLKELKNKKWNILSEDMPMPLMVLKQKNYILALIFKHCGISCGFSDRVRLVNRLHIFSFWIAIKYNSTPSLYK